MNLTQLSSHLARIAPAMAKDSAVNNETLIRGHLEEFRQEILDEAVRIVNGGKGTRPQTAFDILKLGSK